MFFFLLENKTKEHRAKERRKSGKEFLFVAAIEFNVCVLVIRMMRRTRRKALI